jgi:hypothetical protein
VANLDDSMDYFLYIHGHLSAPAFAEASGPNVMATIFRHEALDKDMASTAARRITS